MANLEKLKSIATNKSNWLEEAKTRQSNKEWMKYSQKIAIKILQALRAKKMKQTELADIIGVSAQQVNKIVKGQENLTIETIYKLEQALAISLIFSEAESFTFIKEYPSENSQFIIHTQFEKESVASKISKYDTETYAQSMVNEEIECYG